MAAEAGQYQRRLSVLAAFICEFDRAVNGFAFVAECALQLARLYDPLLAPLQHDELDELGHLVKSSQQPNQKDDRNRDPDQPQQKTAAHGVLLFTLLSTLLHRLNALPMAKFRRSGWELINFLTDCWHHCRARSSRRGHERWRMTGVGTLPDICELPDALSVHS
jgi:hypothetical protein